MTQREDLYQALRNADAAGDTAAATRLADYIQTLPAETAAKEPAPRPQNTDVSLKDRALQATASGARSLGLAGRSMINAVASLPLAAADFGIGARNLLTGENNQSASDMWNQGLDSAGLLKPETTPEKITDVGTQMLVGSKIPLVTGLGDKLAGMGGDLVSKLSSSYKPQLATNLGTLLASQKAGYVVPPSTTNPTMLNKIVESIGGKIATAQDAAAKNADVTNSLVKSANGLPEHAPLTEGAFDAIRKEAGGAYKAVSKLGDFDATAANLPKSVATTESQSALLFGKNNKVAAGELVRAWKQANADATAYYRAYARDANPETLAKALQNKTDAKSVNDFIVEQASKQGNSKLVDELKAARIAIAKSYSAEKAFNPATGNVNAVKLGQALTKGAPLSGDMLTAAKFGQAFPKAAQAITDSGSVRNTDVLAGAGAAALDQDPKWLLYPFARMAARKLLLSPMGQKLAIPSELKDQSGNAMATMELINALR